MRSPHPPGWSDHAATVAWFEAWLRAVRSGVPGSADIAAAQLRLLGVVVAPSQQGQTASSDGSAPIGNTSDFARAY